LLAPLPMGLGLNIRTALFGSVMDVIDRHLPDPGRHAQVRSMLAFLSVNLGIINLLPFLPFDGGHIFWALVEKARGGRPVPTVALERASIVGFALVIMLFAIGLSNDLPKVFRGQGFINQTQSAPAHK